MEVHFAIFPVLLSMILLWQTRSKTKELNDKFQRRFGPNSQFDRDHPGVNQYWLQAVALTLVLLVYTAELFVRTFVTTDVALQEKENHLAHLFYVVVVLSGPGLVNTIIIPWMYLLGDRRIRGGLKKMIGTWRRN